MAVISLDLCIRLQVIIAILEIPIIHIIPHSLNTRTTVLIQP